MFAVVTVFVPYFLPFLNFLLKEYWTWYFLAFFIFLQTNFTDFFFAFFTAGALALPGTKLFSAPGLMVLELFVSELFAPELFVPGLVTPELFPPGSVVPGSVVPGLLLSLFIFNVCYIIVYP